MEGVVEMVTHVSLNSAGYLLVETHSETIAAWAGDNRLVAKFTEQKDNPRIAGLIIRYWASGDEKRIRSRFHFREDTGSWHISLTCSGLQMGPFGRTIIPDPDFILHKGNLELLLPRITTPLIKKVFSKPVTDRGHLEFHLNSKGLRVEGFTNDPKELARFIDKLTLVKSSLGGK